MLSRDSRQERKWKAWRRMQFAYLQRCQRIDFEEDVLGPEIEAMKSGKRVAEMPPAALFEIEFIDETPNQVQIPDPASEPSDPAT
jgi:hypothetical protein